jgi:hypothetical protein
MINDLPCVGGGGRVVVLCVMCFGELMSLGNVGLCAFECACTWVVVSIYCMAMLNNTLL